MQGEAEVFSKAAWRLMPFRMLLYVMCYSARMFALSAELVISAAPLQPEAA
jgi:hypothetical protein